MNPARYVNQVHKLTYMNLKIDRGWYPLQNMDTDNFFLSAVSTMRHFISTQTDSSDFTRWFGTKAPGCCSFVCWFSGRRCLLRFKVFWRSIKPYVGAVSKVGGFTDCRRNTGILSMNLVFVSWLTMTFMQLSYTYWEQRTKTHKV